MSYDDPRTCANPQRLKWEVYPVDRKGRQCGSAVYVEASNYERALACGTYWRRVLNMRPSKTVVAKRYYPQNDINLIAGGWVVKTPSTDDDRRRA